MDSVLGEGSEKYLEKLNMGEEDPMGTCIPHGDILCRTSVWPAIDQLLELYI